MKRFAMILLVAVTAFALIGSPGVSTMSSCSPWDPWNSGNWCTQ